MCKESRCTEGRTLSDRNRNLRSRLACGEQAPPRSLPSKSPFENSLRKLRVNRVNRTSRVNEWPLAKTARGERVASAGSARLKSCPDTDRRKAAASLPAAGKPAFGGQAAALQSGTRGAIPARKRRREISSRRNSGMGRRSPLRKAGATSAPYGNGKTFFRG